jgi:hypothetical protein
VVQDDTGTFTGTLTHVSGTTYTDFTFTYTISTVSNHSLYTRIVPSLFLPPNFIDISKETNAINNAENGIVYISTNTENYWGLRAVVIYNLGIFSVPNVKFSRWQRSSINSIFTLTGTGSLNISSIQGTRQSGYYITDTVYNSNYSVGPYGMTYAFYTYTYCTDPGMANYFPSNWQFMSSPNVRKQFPSSL